MTQEGDDLGEASGAKPRDGIFHRLHENGVEGTASAESHLSSDSLRLSRIIEYSIARKG